ncbi:hypothetical protein CPC16_009771 [Podila verticillata]|nr:hypothetical protein CPC16_009771 [Podila verticillata]KAI9238901.1 MAG: hypothetical protein BYD32DRAFT_248662 [Podila humilis]
MADTEMKEREPSPAPIDTAAPSPSLYIKNLNEKIKLEVLKKSLKALFGQYGEVLNIVAHGNIRMRGQAFVIFEDKDIAAKAMSEVQGFPLYGKPMVIQFSKNKSDIHAQKDGTYEEHHNERLAKKELFAHEFNHKKRQAKLATKRKEQQQQALELQQQQMAQHAQYAQYPGQVPPTGAPVPTIGGVPGVPMVPMVPDEYLPRNSILFLQNLPHDIPEAQLVSLFQQYPGFKEVRTVPGKSGIAFVEYDNEYYSAAAKTALAEYQIGPDHKMKVTFARK